MRTAVQSNETVQLQYLKLTKLLIVIYCPAFFSEFVLLSCPRNLFNILLYSLFHCNCTGMLVLNIVYITSK